MQTQMLWHWSHPHVSLYKSRHQMQCQKQWHLSHPHVSVYKSRHQMQCQKQWHLSHPHVSIYKSCHQMQSQKQWQLHSPPPPQGTRIKPFLQRGSSGLGDNQLATARLLLPNALSPQRRFSVGCWDSWTRVAIKLKYTVYRIRNCFMPLQIYNRLVPSICILMSRDF